MLKLAQGICKDKPVGAIYELPLHRVVLSKS